MLNETFPERLQRLRTARGMTKSTLAERVGASDVSIGFWERGKRVPSAENLAALARVFGLSLDYLWLGPARKRRAS